MQRHATLIRPKGRPNDVKIVPQAILVMQELKAISTAICLNELGDARMVSTLDHTRRR